MIKNLGARAAFTLALALGVFASARAEAYCRTNSCDPTRGDHCSRDDNNCLQGGLPLAWTSDCITFNVQQDGSTKNNISADAFEQVISTAFDTWMASSCSGGTHPSISVSSTGLVECDKVEYNKDQGNANIYMFRDDTWVGGGPDALALTTVWYDFTTGQIYDADTEINGTGGDITNSSPRDGADLPSIVTHEAGHFLGLDHTNVPNATMDAVYAPGIDNLRVLSADDEAGVCAIYPADRKLGSTSCTPRHGFQSACGHPITKSSCSVSPGPTRPSSVALIGLALVAGVSVARRRRKR